MEFQISIRLKQTTVIVAYVFLEGTPDSAPLIFLSIFQYHNHASYCIEMQFENFNEVFLAFFAFLKIFYFSSLRWWLVFILQAPKLQSDLHNFISNTE